MPQAHGRPCWYDLMSADTAGSIAFYTETFRWKTMEWDGPMDYTMLLVHGMEMPFGGLMELPQEAADMGAPPHWLFYVNVDDVDASAAKVTELGGRIYRPPSDIPEVGRFAVVADPQGAVFALFTSNQDAPEDEWPELDDFFHWHELNTTDDAAARAFYTELFGWQETDSHDMGPDFGTYWMFGLRGSTYGGMSRAAKVMGTPPHWLPYLKVADIDATCERFKANGGQVINGPMEVPGGGRVAQCMDPQGAAIGLSWQPPKG